VTTWLMSPRDPRRLAAEARQLRLMRELERAAIRAGINVRLKRN
jgi:hypothetical protein